MAVGLLTLLFTFLGTITGAVLTGMMMATVGHRRWQTVPVSLVFPAMVVALVYVAKIELPDRQRILLPTLCFGAFWLMYLLTCALVRCEKKVDVDATSATPGPSTRTEKQESGRLEDAVKHGNLGAATAEPAGELRLDQLQGKWSRESTGPTGEPQIKILEIAGSNLSLSALDPHGRACPLAKGAMQLKSPEPNGNP
jgi:hypothetical protein